MAGRKGHAVSAATRAKISAALRGKPHPHKGHAVSAATRAKISAALRGKPHKGHAISAATRAKISAALKGRPHPHKGHAMSAATRAKISAALRARHPATHTVTARKPRASHPAPTARRNVPSRPRAHTVKSAKTHAVTTTRAAQTARRRAGVVIGSRRRPMVRQSGAQRRTVISTIKGLHRSYRAHLRIRHHRPANSFRIRRWVNHRVRPPRR